MKIIHSALLILLIGMSNQSIAASTCKTDSEITKTTPSSDFIVHGDGTTTHKKTGLMWKQCTEGLTTTTVLCDTGTVSDLDWVTSYPAAENSTFAGHANWRLPNAKELASIIERQCMTPAINESIFPNTVSLYMTSTPNINSTADGTAVFFDTGIITNAFKALYFGVRLVRNVN